MGNVAQPSEMGLGGFANLTKICAVFRLIFGQLVEIVVLWRTKGRHCRVGQSLNLASGVVFDLSEGHVRSRAFTSNRADAMVMAMTGVMIVGIVRVGRSAAGATQAHFATT